MSLKRLEKVDADPTAVRTRQGKLDRKRFERQHARQIDVCSLTNQPLEQNAYCMKVDLQLFSASAEEKFDAWILLIIHKSLHKKILTILWYKNKKNSY